MRRDKVFYNRDGGDFTRAVLFFTQRREGQRSKEVKDEISTSLRGAPKGAYSREDVDARRGNLIILMRNES
jgi:hypothetical protein